MNVLILGGDGFIGSHLVDKIVELGHCVTVFDRFSYKVSKNLEHQRGRIRFLSGEFANRNVLKDALVGQNVVYHFIWTTNPAASWNDPFVELEQNLRPSLQLFELAAAQGVQKLVFPSSGGTVYGRQSCPITEDLLPEPFSPYGIGKLSTEFFLKYFIECTNLAVDIYRIGNAYGPRQPTGNPQGVIAVWMQKILEGSPIEVYGDHDTLRDYVYIEDIAHLMTHSLRDCNCSDVYNLGTGQGISILELLDIFLKTVDPSFLYNVLPRRSFDNFSVVLDSSKLLAFFQGFKFQLLEDSLAETWRRFKSENKHP